MRRADTLVILLIVVLVWPSVAQAQASETVYYFHTDAIGSVRMITDEAGQEVARYDYLPFGEEWGPTSYSNVPNDRKFAGLQRDAETGLAYAGARYYASQTGRFTTVDPGHVGGDISDSQSWNGYAYARNNPLKYTDSTGTEYEICIYGEYAAGSTSCGSVKDLTFEALQRNPGAGYRLWGGAVFLGDQVVGYYNQTSLDWTFDNFARLTGELSSRWLREQATEMAKGAALSAATMGVGLGVRAGLEAFMAARAPTVVFKIGAVNMAALSSAGIDASTAREAARLLIRTKLGAVPSAGTRIEGFVEINGRLLKITAGVNTAGEVSVGAIRVIR